jgi:hypothetical protein
MILLPPKPRHSPGGAFLIQAAVDRSMGAIDTEEYAFRVMLATVPTTEVGRLALARYGCELDEDGSVPFFLTSLNPPCDDWLSVLTVVERLAQEFAAGRRTIHLQLLASAFMRP